MIVETGNTKVAPFRWSFRKALATSALSAFL
jgi:hypothetical protein